MDSLFFIPDPVKLTKVEESAITSSDMLSMPLNNQQSSDVDEKTPEDKVEVEVVGRPVDLYKVFYFSVKLQVLIVFSYCFPT